MGARLYLAFARCTLSAECLAISVARAFEARGEEQCRLDVSTNRGQNYLLVVDGEQMTDTPKESARRSLSWKCFSLQDTFRGLVAGVQ